MLFHDSTILITGGATGIGFALAQRLQTLGNSIIICGRRQERLQEAASALPGLITFCCDVALEEDRFRLFEFMVSNYPTTNVLINNAGIQYRPDPVTSPHDWRAHSRELATNLHAPIHLSLLFARYFFAKPEAAIVNVTSGLAFAPIAAMATYCASKAGLHSFTLSLREQLRGANVRVIEVIPPKVNTDLGGVGLHDDGAPLMTYVDSVMDALLAGRLEFGFGTSEISRSASREELDAIFARINATSRQS